MKLLLILFLLILSFNISAQDANPGCKPDTARIAMLQFTNYRVRIFDSTYRSTVLDQTEYCSFQKILITFFNQTAGTILNLNYKDHKIQYIPVVDTNGKKLVLINGFCKNYGGFNIRSWKDEIVRPADGGHCFFLGIVDLSEKILKDMWFNGEAKIKKMNSEQNLDMCDATLVE